MHDLEIGQGSYGTLKMLRLQNRRFRFETGGSGFHGSDPNLNQDFNRIWLIFSDSWKGLCPVAYIYVGHDRL
jgi:hypothetical protein